MQESEEIRKLFERYRDGKCTPDEEKRLHAWFNHYAMQEASGLDELQEAHETNASNIRTLRRQWLRYAAVFLFVGLSVAAWFIKDDIVQTTTPEMAATPTEDILPGGNKAILKLADGRAISLNEDQAEIAIRDGRIVYAATDMIVTDTEEDNTMELRTPNGGTYALTLSDGTKVWLNAASSLKYPMKFSAEKRQVKVEGEAFFDVVHDSKRPFTVLSSGQEIEVLGTAFNVSAYADDGDVKTTLVEGAVRLIAQESGAYIQLRPNEQAILKDGKLKTRRVDTQRFTAWKNGDFYFHETPLEDMMKELSRWYDVEVTYEQTVPQEFFNGGMSRSVSLNTVLEFLRISEIPYEIEGRTMKIYTKK
ncbi:DUF4974 domain-containing protein [Sphingobacterium phlebotomi]|uniref:DUF4974 domain-containing protein n=1 Tax=Sphingobacterium phlebotomi TaxID=2605433 RepID=A0A5D4H4Y9_9SPHI|nr:FecR family protein [Sphingobacterium phlebotomi]TYR35099.1 DUF4974 domain-containing protein [Sphingobacterium phlebotomi]